MILVVSSAGDRVWLLRAVSTVEQGQFPVLKHDGQLHAFRQVEPVENIVNGANGAGCVTPEQEIVHPDRIEEVVRVILARDKGVEGGEQRVGQIRVSILELHVVVDNVDRADQSRVEDCEFIIRGAGTASAIVATGVQSLPALSVL